MEFALNRSYYYYYYYCIHTFFEYAFYLTYYNMVSFLCVLLFHFHLHRSMKNNVAQRAKNLCTLLTNFSKNISKKKKTNKLKHHIKVGILYYRFEVNMNIMQRDEEMIA